MSFEFDLGEELMEENQYFVDEQGYLCRYKQTKDGKVPSRLANFEAKITQEIVEDNGVDIKHFFVIEGKTSKGLILDPIEVPLNQFSSLNWIYQWGNKAIIEPGQTGRDYLRHSIQTGSNGIQHKTFYAHTGWRQINNEWAYLSADGAIGQDDVSIKLPRELQRYRIPTTIESEIEAIRASLSFLDIGERSITLPLWCFIYLSPLTTLLNPMPNFSGYIQGETGCFKTTLAVIALSHFGYFGANNLNNFDDTANALEKRSFILKDSLMVLDDYHPSTKKSDAQYKESLAQRIIRSYSNRTGRGRLAPDTSDKGKYEPRGMLLITGEEFVALQSTIARIMPIEISEGNIIREKLSEIQKSLFLLPYAMSSYLFWVRDHIQKIIESFNKQFIELREKAFKNNAHMKLPEQLAFLQFSLDTVISWINDKGIISDNEAFALSGEGWKIFTEMAGNQRERLTQEDSVELFKDILQTLIAQGRVRIEDKNDPPTIPIIGGISGDFIGYYDESYMYLLPPALWQCIQRFCLSEGSHFPFSKNTFYRLLANRNLIVTKGNRNVINLWSRGKNHRVLQFFNKGICENKDKKVSEA
jgi:hypothetical protein